MTEPRLCPTCTHCFIDMGNPGYSSWTPGTGASLECLKGHWKLGDYDSMAAARKAMHTAETCRDYQLYREPA